MAPVVQIVFTGLVTLAAAFGGSLLAGHLQTDLWKKQAVYQLATDTFSRRVTVFKDLSAVLSEAQLIKLHHGPPESEGSKLLINLLYCVNTTDEHCKVNMDDKQTADLAKELFSLQSRFESARAEANVLFCAKTRHALEQFLQGPWWWNSTQQMRAELLSSLEGEITCEIGLLKILR